MTAVSETLSRMVHHATAGDHKWQMYLGWEFAEGKLVERDIGKGWEWMVRAAESNEPYIAFNVGKYAYLYKPEQCRKILDDLMFRGFKENGYTLGIAFERGVGGGADIESAKAAWKSAAENGHLPSMLLLETKRRKEGGLIQRTFTRLRLLPQYFRLLRLLVFDRENRAVLT